MVILFVSENVAAVLLLVLACANWFAVMLLVATSTAMDHFIVH
jgi:hypothetical protein